MEYIVNIVYDITHYTPSEKGDSYCPPSPAEIEFEAYFANELDEKICKVPDELVEFLKVERDILRREKI